MTVFAPAKLLSGQAIDDRTDPHLAPGGHIRLLPHPALGLPIAPIEVSRATLDHDMLVRVARHDVIWVDSRGRALSVPFTVEPDNPVIGWLPTTGGARCIWIEVLATAGSPAAGPLRYDDFRLAGRAQQDQVAKGAVFEPEWLPARRAGQKRPWSRRGGLHLAQIEPTPMGPAVVGSRSAAPYQLAGSQIQQVRLSGSGRVQGVNWLDAQSLAGLNPKQWQKWALPHLNAPRYISMFQAEAMAEQRVQDGAPRREALFDAPGATPATAPTIAAPEATEVDRVMQRYSGSLKAALDRVLTDLGRSADELAELVPCFDERNVAVGSVQMNLLRTLQVATLDAGIARLFGLAGVDTDVPQMGAGTLVLYIVGSWWDPDALARRSPLLGGAVIAGAATSILTAEQLNRQFDHRLTGVKNGMLLATVVPLLVGIPPDRPWRPVLGSLLGGPWSSHAVPPAARRQVVLPLAGLEPAHLLAFARVESTGPLALHEKGPDGRMLPLTAAQLPDATAPGQGELSDRDAPADAARFRVAQQDMFGRWSDWSEGAIGPGQRPRLPRPVPELHYQPPGDPLPTHSSPLPGTVRISVAVPQPTQLPPGCRMPDRLEYTLAGGAPQILTVVGGTTTVVANVPGPALGRCAEATLTLSCRWRDTSGVYSDPSPELSRKIRDPRAPEALVLPQTLAFGSRPDVTGKSRLQLRWTEVAGATTYRVYTSDETTLMTTLEKAGRATDALRASLATAADAGARAAIFVAEKARFGRTCFELVSPEALATTAIEHRVSGSLRVLVFLRIVPVSGANVEGEFAISPMVPFGIPNSGAPATPLLAVRPIFEAGVAQASVHIRVPRGPLPAAQFRLRRSAVESRIVERMPVVDIGAVPALVTGAGPESMQEVPSYLDTGGSELKRPDPLKPWTAYTWRAEVRGVPEPGSNVAGEWSAPSAPVTTAIIPPSPPASATDGRWDTATQLSFTHPEALVGGSIGEYRIDLYAQPPGGGPMAFVATLSADAPASIGGRNPDRSGRFRFTLPASPPSGTMYRAIVFDPAGRSSPPSASLLAP
jgi:hypothetical protein